MPVAPEETERIATNHFAPLKLRLTWAEGWVGVEPAREASLTTTVGTGTEPSERNRLIDALMAIAPIQFEALLLAENANRDGCSLCWFLHREILGFAGKRQMSGYDDANQWGY
jgi:hypothetical protein